MSLSSDPLHFFNTMFNSLENMSPQIGYTPIWSDALAPEETSHVVLLPRNVKLGWNFKGEKPHRVRTKIWKALPWAAVVAS